MPKRTRIEIENDRPWAQQAEVEIVQQPEGYYGNGFWVKRARSGRDTPEICLEETFRYDSYTAPTPTRRR